MAFRTPIAKLLASGITISTVPVIVSKWNRAHCDSRDEPKKYIVSQRIKEISKDVNVDPMDLVVGACATAGALIVGLLLLSLRTTNRTDRTMKVITHAERILLNHGGIRENIGLVLAGGSHRIGVQNNVAHGIYSATIPGGVKCMVYLHATRPDSKTDDWEYDTLKLEVDSNVLLDRVHRKYLDSVKFNYMTMEEAEEAKEKFETAILQDAENSGGGVEFINMEDGSTFECLAYYLRGDYDSFVEHFPKEGARPSPEMK